MAENTIDTLQLNVESDAQKAVKALNSLSSSLLGVQKAAKRMDASSLTKFSSGIKGFANSMEKFKDLKVPDFSNFADNMSKLKGIDLKSSGVTNTVNALKRLSEVEDLSKSAKNISKITGSIGGLASIPDVSRSLNRFVSSLTKLASAGDSAGIVANNLPTLGKALKDTVSDMSTAPQISESVNMFVQSIGRLASAGDKTGRTASQLGSLAQETLAFFQTMEKAPQISSNTIRMTEALAQLANAGGKVGTASNTVTSAFNKLSSVGTKVSNSLKKVATGISNAFTKITRASSSLKVANLNLATVLKTAIGFRAVQGLMEFGRSAVQLSSDLTEVQNVVDVTFGKMANKVEELASKSIGDFGLSELTLKKISSRFQAMGVAMGFTQDKMSDMSLELTKLAADMASFYNVEQEDVAKDLEAVFTGMTRPLRQYGLDLTQTTLQEWALKKGLDANIQSMSQAEKTMLRYQYVMENTSAAHGDFTRTVGRLCAA